MEISLLLSAAQAAPTADIAHTPQGSYLTSSPLSYQSSPAASNVLHGLELYEARQETFSNNSTLSPQSQLSPLQHSYSLPSSQGRVDKRTTKPFRCNFERCDATFGQKGSLTRHVKSRHEKLRPHACDLCQKSFSALWTLRVHQRNVHLKSKPHKCHLCDKSFGELFNKSKHIAIVHEGKRPFSCPICSRAFGYKGDMRKHVLELHEQSGRPFQCMVPSCGVKFARKRYLRRHENLSHKGQTGLSTRELPSSPVTSPNFSYGAVRQRPSLFYLGTPAAAGERSSVAQISIRGQPASAIKEMRHTRADTHHMY